MFARWVLSDLVALDTLASAIDDLLPPAVSAAIAETVTTAGGKWPARSAAAGR